MNKNRFTAVVTAALLLTAGIINGFPYGGYVTAEMISEDYIEIDSENMYREMIYSWDESLSISGIELVESDPYYISGCVTNSRTKSGKVYTQISLYEADDYHVRLRAYLKDGSYADVVFETSNYDESDDIHSQVPTPATQAPATMSPTEAPTSSPATMSPTEAPTSSPATMVPTEAPTTSSPATMVPTEAPATQAPSTMPPTNTPTAAPSDSPSVTLPDSGNNAPEVTSAAVVTTTDSKPAGTTPGGSSGSTGANNGGDADSAVTTVTDEEEIHNYFGFYEMNDFGDVNSDSKVDILDLTYLSLHFIGEYAFSNEAEKMAADVMYDYRVNLADLARLRQYISKKAVTLGPSEKIIFSR